MELGWFLLIEVAEVCFETVSSRAENLSG